MNSSICVRRVLSVPPEPEEAIIELRTYKLVAGGRDEFHRLFEEGAVPLLVRRGIAVAAYGPSLDGDDHYFLMRTFASVAERDRQLDAFYGSEEWQRDHRAAILALIETYHTVTLPLVAPVAALAQ
jgi:hypothetical protein